MREAVFAVPGDLSAPTGGYAYARRLLALLPEHGITVRHLALPGSFPSPSPADLAATERLLAERPRGAALLLDGLAGGAIPARILVPHAGRLVALVHHPLAFESGLIPERRAALVASERATLALARRVIASSRTTARLLAGELGVDEGRITVAEPGTDPSPRARGGCDPPLVLSVGAITPRKGFDVLVAALAMIADLSWRAVIAGALDRSPETVVSLRSAIHAAGLDERVTLAGTVDDDRLAGLFDEADLFCLPTRYEGFGMVLAEAMARGLPIVTTTGGAAAETLPDEAGLKVPPDDAPALAGALRLMLEWPERRRAFADASWRRGQRLARWPETAATVAAVLCEVAA